MTHAHRTRFLLPLLGLLAAVAACTSKQKDEPANTLHYAVPERVKGLDPIHSDDLYSNTMVHKVYESLFQYHYLKRPYQLIPNLAESMPEVSADGKTITIKLKKGVLFQDDASFKETNGKGREMTADDVIYSWRRLADPKLVSTGWWVFEGKIEGLDEWREEGSKSGNPDYSKPISGLQAVDRYTLRIKLKSRSWQFLYVLAMPFTSVVPREAAEHYGKEFLNHPVGTGPFKLEEFNGAQRVIFVKNPTYRKELYPSEGAPGDKEAGLLEDAGQPLPRSERLVYTVFVESQPQWLNFMSGKLDVSGIPKDNYSQAITAGKELAPELKAKGITLHKEVELDVTHFSFNMDDPIVGKNKYLRQAMSLALNGGPMIDLFYNGRALPAQGPIPPGLAGYDPNFKNPYRQFNLAKAKELMAKAGYPDGKGLDPIEYVTTSSTTSRQLDEYYEKSFAAIGVKLKINAYSWPEFSAAIKNKKGQAWAFAWGADYPDAENFLGLFYSKNASPGSNDANYRNPEFDKLFDKALTLPDSPERTKLYQQMRDIVVEDCPWIFGVHRIVYYLNYPWVKNYSPHDLELSAAKYHRVDPALKK